MSQQPQWEFVANLGDVNFIKDGGLLVYRDKTGVYPAVMDVLEPFGQAKVELYSVQLERCYFTNGVLSDNKLHLDHPAWFAKGLDGVCSSHDVSREGLIALLTSDDPRSLAEGYRCLGGHFGWIEFDHEPLVLTRAEAKQIYALEGDPLVAYLKAIASSCLLSSTVHNGILAGEAGTGRANLWTMLVEAKGESQAKQMVADWIAKPYRLPRV